MRKLYMECNYKKVPDEIIINKQKRNLKKYNKIKN